MPILMFDKDENFSVLRLEDVSFTVSILLFLDRCRLWEMRHTAYANTCFFWYLAPPVVVWP